MDSDAVSADLRADLEAARGGESAALGRVLERCRAYLLAIANAELDSGLRPKGGASDLVQDSLLDAQRAFGKFHGDREDDLLAWLKRILKNNLIDQVRRYRETAGRNVDHEAPFDQEGLSGEQFPAEGASPLDALVVLEKKAALEAALARLPEEYRRVIDLRHRDGKSFPEIGAALDKWDEAARKLWFRALEHLRQELKRHDELRSST